MEDKIKDVIKKAPKKPGVYLFKDERDRILYVGKAVDLYDRLHSYLTPQDPKVKRLVKVAKCVEYIITDSDADALILEENLIKLNKPKYNVRLKDDKKYPYLKITIREEFPRIFVTRDERKDGNILFGPYTSVRNLKKAVHVVKKVFGIRTCKYKIPEEKPNRPCLYFQLNLCSAPCIDKIDKKDYREKVTKAIKFLSGQSEEIEKEMEKRMWEYAENQDYEKAAMIRDRLIALREVKRTTRVVSEENISRDYIAVAKKRNLAIAYVLKVREKRVFAKEDYALTLSNSTGEEEVISTILRSIYTHTYDVPDEIITSIKVEDERFFTDWFKKYRNKNVKILWNVREERKKLLDIAKRNAEILLSEQTEEKRIPLAVSELQRFLNLKKPPLRIEGIDISNIQGKQPTGSLVVFVDGKPKKSAYRKFKIKTKETPDDFGMMKEVLKRRIKRLLNEKKSLPDLIIIDGGKGQLSAGIKALEETGVDIPIFAFAKTTDHLFAKDGREYTIPAYTSAIKLLWRIREEAHRFAVTFHRKLRRKKLIESQLDRISGIGKKRKKILLEHFGTVKNIKKASLFDLSRIPGIGMKFAKRIYEFFHPDR